ncbi:hypothetical protein FKG94_19675 [Exilibacterium tricleocarpae]|uniref:Lipoprotein n=1 Tax=Exilibacterium tricleocarpae TaxID=2591008 RepID=A0A545T299_9GAMM|nr:hypothetical protein [Exilibacterium tricleocarpae]TQV71336.1 hypothetical protein FKG94_19675 [Exilibacterium tricleocarpae]
MHSFWRISIVAVLLFVLAGCTGLTPSEPLPLAVSISFKAPERSRFSGKGAGAGMMLSSTMGAAGVAIGIAIDEGIGKDIQAAADAGGIAVKPLLMATLQGQTPLPLEEIDTAAAGPANLSITVKRYGFVLQPGAGGEDPTAAQFILSLSRAGADTGNPLELNFPADFEWPGAGHPPTVPLAQLKVSAADIEHLWRDALQRIFTDSRVATLLQQ